MELESAVPLRLGGPISNLFDALLRRACAEAAVPLDGFGTMARGGVWSVGSLPDMTCIATKVYSRWGSTYRTTPR